MSGIAILSEEQIALREQIKNLISAAYKNEAAQYHPAIIQQAHALLDRAVELNSPTALYAELQILLSGYANEEALPVHLRSEHFPKT